MSASEDAAQIRKLRRKVRSAQQAARDNTGAQDELNEFVKLIPRGAGTPKERLLAIIAKSKRASN